MMGVIEYEPLARYTSWRIGGPARYFTQVTTVDQLRHAQCWADERGVPLFMLGGGTNILVHDDGFPGLVIRYRAQEMRIEATGDHAYVTIDAGAPMAGTARRLAGLGWDGLVWAEGLPGTVGGAVFGNAGCYGGDIASVLTRAWLLEEGAIVEWPLERFAYMYRRSVLKAMVEEQGFLVGKGDGVVVQGSSRPIHRPFIVAAEFRLRRADPHVLAEQMRGIAAERRLKTPVGSSCGSVFKNPPGESAGRLIESAGLKGARSGAAEISPKHANYIVNHGGARSGDVLALIALARERVLDHFGVTLELEVQLVGVS